MSYITQHGRFVEMSGHFIENCTAETTGSGNSEELTLSFIAQQPIVADSDGVSASFTITGEREIFEFFGMIDQVRETLFTEHTDAPQVHVFFTQGPESA